VFYFRLLVTWIIINQPTLQAKMAQMDDRAWKEREAAVASIGAIAKAHVTKPRFSQVF
jgi:hypothetical protein